VAHYRSCSSPTFPQTNHLQLATFTTLLRNNWLRSSSLCHLRFITPFCSKNNFKSLTLGDIGSTKTPVSQQHMELERKRGRRERFNIMAHVHIHIMAARGLAPRQWALGTYLSLIVLSFVPSQAPTNTKFTSALCSKNSYGHHIHVHHGHTDNDREKQHQI
jgi:hypothetical protein